MDDVQSQEDPGRRRQRGHPVREEGLDELVPLRRVDMDDDENVVTIVPGGPELDRRCPVPEPSPRAPHKDAFLTHAKGQRRSLVRSRRLNGR